MINDDFVKYEDDKRDEYIRLDTTIIGIDNLIAKASTAEEANALFKAKDVIYSQQWYFDVTVEAEPVHENPENGNKESEQYCHDCKHNEVCKYYPHNGCDFKEKAEGWIDDESMENEDMRPDNEVI